MRLRGHRTFLAHCAYILCKRPWTSLVFCDAIGEPIERIGDNTNVKPYPQQGVRCFRGEAYNIVVTEERKLNRIGRWLRAAVKPGSGLLEPAFGLVFIFLVAVPVAQEPPNILTVRVALAREIVNHLRGELSIRNEVDIALVKFHPLVFFVEPEDGGKQRFRLSMEVDFFLRLDDDELLAALAHEMGHVWIFTHFPFLHTEMLANVIGQRVAPRRSFERIYTKLWAYERTTGVPMDDLLGPVQGDVSPKIPTGDLN